MNKVITILLIVLIVSTTLEAQHMTDTLKSLIEHKEAEKIIDLISHQPEVLDQKDENGSTGFLLLAYSGLNEVFDKAKKLKKHFTFHESIVSGDLDHVRQLVSSDKNLVNTYSNDGFTPLSLAAFFNQTEIAIFLLKNGANPNIQATNPSKVNALHSAVARGNYELCVLLIQYGVRVNTPQMQQVTALHSAAHRGNLMITKLLVEHGADIHLKMETGETAIDIAKRDGHADVLQYLEGLQ